IKSAEDGVPVALWLCLTVIDNGTGLPLPLDVGALVRSGHMGLASMRERAEQLDGWLDIRGEPAGGTRVTIMSPLLESSMPNLHENKQALHVDDVPSRRR